MFSVIVVATLIVAAVCDVRWRIIPHAVIAALGATGLVAAVFGGVVGGGLAPAAVVAAGLFALGVLAFSFGVMGGGDAKLLGAVGFWVPPAALHDFFTVMALTGAVLALVVVARRRLVAAVTGEAAADAASVPYGAAIAAGAGYVLLAPV